MRQIDAFEAKKTLDALLNRVERGEEIIITRDGKAVARLVPNAGAIDRADVKAAMARIRARARTLSAGPIEWDILKADWDTGRR